MESLATAPKRKTYTVTPDMVGKYINQCLWSDVNPVAKIIGIKGKATLICCRVTASEQKTPMSELGYSPGGFAGHYSNQYAQSYDYYEHPEDVFEVRYSKAMSREKFYRIHDAPVKFYDYNF